MQGGTVTTSRQHDQPAHGSHAIVVGGSMAGLLAARVLADHFKRVTVIERDRFPEGPTTRKGVPQARHVHILLQQGQRVLERLFPGLGRELNDAGAPAVDLPADFPALSLGGWTRRFRSPFVARTCSRSLLEWTIRRHLAGYANVRFLEDRQATGLLAVSGGSRVSGVRVRVRGAADGAADEEEYHAGLVVDASGRGSRAPDWLESLGYAPPRETVVNSFLGYATRWYRRPAAARGDWQGLLVMSKAPDYPRSGVIFPVEGDRWVVTLAGLGRDYPPTDETDFLEFSRSLRSPIIYEAIKDAEPLSPVYGYQRTENRVRHYERLARWPEGFVVLGDAACAFNPVYGQGMTVAALGAEALDKRLRTQRGGDLSGLARRFQRDLAGVSATAWLMATGEDFRWPTTEGGRPSPLTRLMHRYFDGVMALSSRNTAVYGAFIEVSHLCKPPMILFRPGILLRVLAWAVSQPPAAAGPYPQALSYGTDKRAPKATSAPALQHDAPGSSRQAHVERVPPA